MQLSLIIESSLLPDFLFKVKFLCFVEGGGGGVGERAFCAFWSVFFWFNYVKFYVKQGQCLLIQMLARAIDTIKKLEIITHILE